MSTAPFSGFPQDGLSDESGTTIVGNGGHPSGSILRGRYRLGASIGRGGMGEVFEAVELATGRLVAVKVVSRSFADELLMARLHREAEAARRVRSEFVPELYDIDSTADGELFLVMERLYGETLAQRLRGRSLVLGWEEVRALGEDMLRGLIDAHAAGVVHRDLKPGNIFLESRGGIERAKILDFGVCKLDAHDGESLTSTGEAVGTISYMAPEQIRGASKVDERADVYSFATVIFEALSGRLAHDASGQIAMIASKLERPARNLREVVRVPVPLGLDGLLARCLSRRPDDRVATASDLLRAWRALGAPTLEPVTGPVVERPDLHFSGTETGVTAGALTERTPQSTRIGLIVAACALGASSIVLAIALLAGGAAPAAPAVSATSNLSPPVAAQSASTTAASIPLDPGPPAIAVSSLPWAPVSLDDDADAAAAVPKPGGNRKRVPVKRAAPPRSGPTTPQISVEPRY